MTAIAPSFTRNGLAVYEKGAGEPVFLMPYPHGYTRVRTAEGPLFAILAEIGRKVITFDPPGAYSSDRAPDVGMPEMLACAAEVMEAAGLSRPVDMVGHSMGGLCVLGMAIERSKTPKKIIVLNSLAGPRCVRRYRALPYNWPYLSQDFRSFVRVGSRAARGKATMREHKLLQRLVMNVSYRDEAYLESHLEDIGPDLPEDESLLAPPRDVWPAKIARIDYTKRLGEIKAPALVITGRYDPQVPESAARDMSGLIPNSKLIIFEDSAHYPFIEEPELFRRELASFLEP
jgi:proline iminopeptidase